MQRRFIVQFTLLVLFITVSLQVVKAQPNNEADLKLTFKEAVDYVSYDEYQTALPLFLNLLKSNPSSCNFNFYVGICYLNSSKERLKSIPYLEKAILSVSEAYNPVFKEKSAPIFSLYHLAEAYHLGQEYDKSIKACQEFKNFLKTNNKEKKLIDQADMLIKKCELAKKAKAKPVVGVTITPFTAINSVFSDFKPVLTPDGLTIYFASRRKGALGGEPYFDEGFSEDIYFSQFQADKWTPVKKVKGLMNSTSIDVISSISMNGKLMAFTRGDKKDFNIYTCELSIKKNIKKWGDPIKLPTTINSKYNEVNASISPDGQAIYFASDKPDGYGGLDIYMSLLDETGKWSIPFNLGPDINTAEDDDCPFIFADGKTLYFSSKGHNSIGGYDIFVTQLTSNGSWTTPKSMGYPINTSHDDRDFFLTPDKKIGFYSKLKEPAIGVKDIYRIEFTNW